ncbi:MAG TPA: hypothetical protein VI756_20930 [Blastocatellia bacterium]
MRPKVSTRSLSDVRAVSRLGLFWVLMFVTFFGAAAGRAYSSSIPDGPPANKPDTKTEDGAAKDSKDAKDAKATAPDSAAASGGASTEEQIRILNEKMKALEDFIREQKKESDEKVARLERSIEQQQKLAQALQEQLDRTRAPTRATGGGPVVAVQPSPEANDARRPADSGGSVATEANEPTTDGARSAGSPAPGNINPPAGSDGTIAAPNASGKPAQDQAESPLALKIGSAYITPVGFADLQMYYRSTNVGSGLGTNFGSIPFSNTPQGQLSETRFTAQASRIGARFDTMIHDAHVIGYFESDFLGFAPVNGPVTTNSYSERIRLAWVDVWKGKFEVLGGQSWSLMTPDRNSLSPMPQDVYYPHLDPNNQLGLTWSRDPQVRFVYHASDTVTLGVSAEQAEQYIGGSGGAGVITLPSALSTAYAGELDNGNTTLTVPNVAPDFVAKIAFDPRIAGRLFHVEFAGLERNFKVYNPVSKQTFTATGGGGSINLYLQLVKNLRLVSDNFYSDGGGRYVFGLEPDLVIRGNGSISLVRTMSTIQGLEYQITPRTLIWGYYGGVYAAKNVVIDPVTHALVGFGYQGSPSSQSRALQEPSFGISRSLWKDHRYGELQFNVQYSYVTRSPWFAPVTGPTTASTNMLFLDMRFLLPGAPPKLPYSYQQY